MSIFDGNYYTLLHHHPWVSALQWTSLRHTLLIDWYSRCICQIYPFAIPTTVYKIFLSFSLANIYIHIYICYNVRGWMHEHVSLSPLLYTLSSSSLYSSYPFNILLAPLLYSGNILINIILLSLFILPNASNNDYTILHVPNYHGTSRYAYHPHGTINNCL